MKSKTKVKVKVERGTTELREEAAAVLGTFNNASLLLRMLGTHRNESWTLYDQVSVLHSKNLQILTRGEKSKFDEIQSLLLNAYILIDELFDKRLAAQKEGGAK